MSAYHARRTPQHKGPAAWSAILPGQAAPVSLDGDLTVDFALIGAGFAGLSAARRLHQLAPGARIAVLDASRLAEGASGRNSGFMIDLPHELQSDDYAGHGDDRAMIALNRQAIAFARAAVEDYDIDRNFFDPVGKVNGAASAKTDALNRSYAEHLATMGESSTYLDAKAMTELTGSRHYVSGLYTPGTVMLQPAGYIRSLAEGLRRDGVSIFENTSVTAITRDGTGWILSTAKGRVSAGKVILSNNGHLESFGFKPGRLMHIFLFASMSAELDADQIKALGGQPRWGVTPSDPMGTTMRRIAAGQGGNRIVTRTCGSFEPDMVTSESDMRRTVAVHRQKFAKRFPQLAGVRQEYTWAGHLCLARNGVSVMRELDQGLFAACVQNGLGTARGTLTGMGAAELACGRTSDITRHFTAEAEPVKLPPRPFSTIGANAFLRYKEWQAKEE
ncbi:NAD(P)/FAD-dependent oxidoreductase [Thioclava sp. FR2]|uniref:NAD(P)/FAD-dependent oxidoreductase n=1 Tax=Thioclava sp. FR2 TaxID=3445780 RepID=UPI003EB8A340